MGPTEGVKSMNKIFSAREMLASNILTVQLKQENFNKIPLPTLSLSYLNHTCMTLIYKISLLGHTFNMKIPMRMSIFGRTDSRFIVFVYSFGMVQLHSDRTIFAWSFAFVLSRLGVESRRPTRDFAIIFFWEFLLIEASRFQDL